MRPFAPPSFATIIDDFSTPQGPLTLGAVSAVSGPGIIGGLRQAGFGDSFEVADGIGTFSVAFLSGNVMSLTYNGTTTLGDISTFPPVDLTDGGLASHLLLGLSGVEGFISMAMGVSDVDGQTAPAVFSGMGAPGVYAVPLPTNLADVTRVNLVSATLFLSPPQGSFSSSASIDFLCTGTVEAGCTTPAPVTAVPEPGTGLMLALVVGVLPLLGRKSRSISTR